MCCAASGLAGPPPEQAHSTGHIAWAAADRNIAWDQDVELGRQMLSGMHPCVIEAATEVPFGTITGDHVAELLEGRSVKVSAGMSALTTSFQDLG